MESEIKCIIPDSSVFCLDPDAMFSFDNNRVYITAGLILRLREEQQKHTDAGTNANIALRTLCHISKNCVFDKKTRQGMSVDFPEAHLPNGGILVFTPAAAAGGTGEEQSMLWLANQFCEMKRKYVIVSQDPVVRLQMRRVGLNAEVYKSNTVIESEHYTGRAEAYTTVEAMSGFFSEKRISISELLDEKGMPHSPFVQNQYVVIHSLCSGNSSSGLGRIEGTDVVRLRDCSNPVYGVKPRNLGQKFALDALMRGVSECPYVILEGEAGTAKTFLALAAGLEGVCGRDPKYKRLLVTRPNVKFDETVGFLKGGEAEKIGPLIRPIMDNLELLTATHADDAPSMFNKKGKRIADDEDANKFSAPNDYTQYLFDKKIIDAQAMEYMRGRSICNTFILVDEAQNMTQTQAYGIVSRAGMGSKIVFAGDPKQVDNDDLDETNNGLVWAAKCFRGSKQCSQIYFNESECERSELAKEAITVMRRKGQQYVI